MHDLHHALFAVTPNSDAPPSRCGEELAPLLERGIRILLKRRACRGDVEMLAARIVQNVMEEVRACAITTHAEASRAARALVEQAAGNGRAIASQGASCRSWPVSPRDREVAHDYYVAMRSRREICRKFNLTEDEFEAVRLRVRAAFSAGAPEQPVAV